MKYLTFNTLIAREFEFWINLHPYFATKASLKLDISLNPIPPWLLAWLICSHFVQKISFFSFLLLHQNLAIACWMPSHSPVEILKTLIAYIGTTCATALISVSFPPLEKHFCCQLKILLWTFSFTTLKKFFIFFRS